MFGSIFSCGLGDEFEGIGLPSQSTIHGFGAGSPLRFRTGPRPRVNVFEEQAAARAANAGFSFSSPSSSATPPPTTVLTVLPPPELELPSKELVGEWLRQLLLRDGVDSVAQAMVVACPPSQTMRFMQELCSWFGGVEPTLDDGQALWESSRRSVPTLEFKRRRLAIGHESSSTAIVPFKYDFCDHCEPQIGGEPGERCKGMSIFDTLQDDLEAQDELVKDEQEHGNITSGPLRAARYYMYRKYVFAAHGLLGKRVRIRIPPCVIQAIRFRFPQPGCDCAQGVIHLCTEHGYVGHREAPSE